MGHAFRVICRGLELLEKKIDNVKNIKRARELQQVKNLSDADLAFELLSSQTACPFDVGAWAHVGISKKTGAVK